MNRNFANRQEPLKMRTIHTFRVAAFAATFLVGLNSASHAQTNDSVGTLDLPLVSPESVPATGTFFLLSTFETNQFRFGFGAPFPYNPLGDQADVFLLGSNF